MEAAAVTEAGRVVMAEAAEEAGESGVSRGRGRGAVPLYHLMEDAATAEISRTQVWQWVRYQATLDDGRVVTPALVEMASPPIV